MFKKIFYSVIFASDEHPEYPASELNSHGPTVQGWRSNLNNKLNPQELILRFYNPAKVYRIQVLGHQYLIPERIELWIHNSPNDTPSTPSSQNFEYLGFIALSDNSTTNYKSRELQSVSVTPRIGTHLKLRLGSPYINKFNTNGQVALIAVNVLGEEIQRNGETGSIENHHSSSSTTFSSKFSMKETIEFSLASICDDLSFSMYVEESIAEIVRELEQKKMKAVNEERFEYARKLKLCMTALRTAGERLGRYALAKRQAVHQEDFTTAKLRKEQIEMYRTSVFNQLEVEKLLEKTSIALVENDQISNAYATKPVLPSPPSLQEVAFILTESQSKNIKSPKMNHKELSNNSSEQSSSMTGSSGMKQLSEEIYHSPQLSKIGRSPNRNSPTNTGSLRRRNKSAPRNSYEDYEERTLPTLRTSQTNEFLRECQGNASGNSELDSSRGRSKLNDRERRQAALPLLVFGNELVELFYSKQFQDREDGLIRLRSILKGQIVLDCNVGSNKIARSATLLLYRSVRDAVFSVFSQAAETVRALFIDYIPQRTSPSEVARCVDRLLPELLAKSGDPSPRIHTLAQHTILSIASCGEVREQNLIAPALSRPVGSGTHPRLALSRIQMLEQLVLSHGISTDKQSGLTCRSLSECGCSGIHHPAETVRKVAERVLLLVYRINPRLIRKQLPPDDDITRRNLLYRQLFTEFDKIDLQRKKEMIETNKYVELKNDPFTSIEMGNSSYQNDDVPDKLVGGKNSPLNCNHHSLRDATESEDWEANFSYKDNKHRTEFSDKLKNGAKHDTNDDLKDNIQCPFCDWTCGKDDSQLDKHYWKSCPILMKCPQCSQILEVAAYSYHLANECEAKNSYVICKRCTEAVHKDLYELHLLEDYCKEIIQGNIRCPLCHENIPDGKWKNHFLDQEGCQGNASRRRFKK